MDLARVDNGSGAPRSPAPLIQWHNPQPRHPGYPAMVDRDDCKAVQQHVAQGAAIGLLVFAGLVLVVVVAIIAVIALVIVLTLSS
jgi:hypothetical protein